MTGGKVRVGVALGLGEASVGVAVRGTDVGDGDELGEGDGLADGAATC